MTDSLHPLDDPEPPFLGDLDRSPDRAAESLCRFALKLLTVSPPGALRTVPYDERDDVVQELILHFLRDDFRVLRSYRNTRHSFAGWFSVVARNLVFDISGEGNLPRISIIKPSIRNKKGQPLLLFKKNLVHHSQFLPLHITNDGSLPSKVSALKGQPPLAVTLNK